MGGVGDILPFVRGNAIRLFLLGVGLLLAIIGAALANTNGYDEAWSVLSIVILIAALFLEGRIVLFYLVLGFIYAVLPKFVMLSDTNNASADNPHHGAALLSAALFLSLFALTPSDGWTQFRARFLGNPVGWFALVVFFCNFFGSLLTWIAIGKNSNLADNGTPLQQSIFAFLNGLLFLIAYAYQYAHASVLGFVLFTFGGIQSLATMVDTTTGFSDTARAGAGFIAFSNFVFIFIIWRVCMAPLSAAQQAHDSAVAPPTNVSGNNVDAPQGSAAAPATPEQKGWRATIFSSLLRFAGLSGCLALCIIGLIILRDTQGVAVIEIAATTAVGLLLVTLFFPTWDYSFIFIYIGIFLASIPRLVYFRSFHDRLPDGRNDGEKDSGLIFIITGTVVAYFIREVSRARLQRFTFGRDLMWLYVVGIVGQLIFIIGLIILFSEADKYHADTTVFNVTVPLVLLLVYFFIQLHLDADLNHRLVLLFLLALFLEADLVAASGQNGFPNNQNALLAAGCGLCAVGLYFMQFVICFLHWNETHKADSASPASISAPQPPTQQTFNDNNIRSGGSSSADSAPAPNPYHQQLDDAPKYSEEQTQSEAPVQTV